MPTARDTKPQKYHPTRHGPEIFPRRPPVLTSAEVEWREEVITFLLKHLHAASANRSTSIEPTLMEKS